MAAAQRRTEEHLTGLTQQVAGLVVAQQETRQQIADLTQQMVALAQAQQRSEGRLDELVRVQKETAQQIADLAVAQGRLSREMGALGNNVGLWVEDIARIVLPGYLERHLGVKLRGQLGEELGRRFLAGPAGEIELDLYGEGEQNGRPVEILGEVKNRLYRQDVERFIQQLKTLEPDRVQRAIKVMFAFWIHPSAQEAAREREVLLVASYQR